MFTVMEVKKADCFFVLFCFELYILMQLLIFTVSVDRQKVKHSSHKSHLD